MSLRHNHGASVSGTKSEKKLKTLTESLGLPFIKERLWGKTLFKPPKHWSQKTKTGKQRKFIADGYIEVPGKKSIIVEQKHSDLGNIVNANVGLNWKYSRKKEAFFQSILGVKRGY